MEKLYASKTFSKMAGGRICISLILPLDPPLAINYKNHQKSLAYFQSVGTINFVMFYLKTESIGEDRGGWHHVLPFPS